MKCSLYLSAIFFVFYMTPLLAQEVPIQDAATDENGRIRISVESTPDQYYVLYIRHQLGGDLVQSTSISMGEDGHTVLTEPLEAYPPAHYTVYQYPIADPADTDNDGVHDIAEFQNPGTMAPLNPAGQIDFVNGVVCIHDRATFKALSYQGDDVLIDHHLEELEFVKFYILDTDTDNPKVYFMNTETHRSHGSFANAVGIPRGGQHRMTQMRGEIIYHPSVISANGKPGVYRFEFEPNDNYPFEEVQMGHELIAANMPFLKNNLSYFPMPNAALPRYFQEKHLYDASRIPILLEEDIFADIDYLALHLAEGYGLLRVMELDERPGSRDIVLYESLPNEMPRVGGIITTVSQTPLSHVNLRAIQDNVPNAFIRDALQRDDISAVIGKYVHYKVEQADYIIREATLQEVEQHYEDLRPEQDQIPLRDLSQTSIKALDDISFEESKSFGGKTANVATMLDFGFPDGTIPDGFGVPFYFYDEFMKYNGFYNQLNQMISTSGFLTDYDIQEGMLSDFRSDIKDGEMPQWMLDELEAMHMSFPEGTSVRCRSSTNNEDLPGFSGAGLYDSKTQHPDEGHISKSIKQVYASMWNFRAFDERQFYRVDHHVAAMGVLVHPNYADEKANGVGVTTDPIYQTEHTFYLNTQIGEDLVTNPDALSVPEEILLDEISSSQDDYILVRPSNQLPDGELIMSEIYLDEIRHYLQVIHDEFRLLYDAPDGAGFAMEIEYKITSEDQLVIKQARPWSGYWVNEVPTATASIFDDQKSLLLHSMPNPFHALTNIEFQLPFRADVELKVLDGLGRKVHSRFLDDAGPGTHSIMLQASDLQGEEWTDGIYFLLLDIHAYNKRYHAVGKVLRL